MFLLLAIWWCTLVKGDTRVFRRFKAGIPQLNGKGILPADERIEVKERRGYTIGFSPRLRQSLWVAYRLTPEDVREDVGRIGNFRRDEDLTYVLPPSRYTGSGYDRGHLAPSADMRYDYTVSRQSFWMGNISPQVPALNRGKWKTLEQRIHAFVTSNMTETPRAREVYVITGPIFEKKQIEHLNDPLTDSFCETPPLLVPKAFYKIYAYNGKVSAELFIQETVSQETTTINRIEELTGLSFFPEMSSGLRAVYGTMTHGIVHTLNEKE